MRTLSAALLFTVALFPIGAFAQEGTEDSPSRGQDEVAEGTPRYLPAMQRELSAMRVPGVRCETLDAERARCRFTARGITTGREFPIHLLYSDRTDTVYMYIERYLSAPTSAASTPAVLRRLMELNWALLVGKFEWNATDGEVRLAITINTDSNFDRRAFRSSIRAIGQLADRYHGELSRLTRQGSD